LMRDHKFRSATILAGLYDIHHKWL
jgi:hypothetical protein